MVQYTALTNLSINMDCQMITMMEYMCRVYRERWGCEELVHFLIIKMRARAAAEEVRGE